MMLSWNLLGMYLSMTVLTKSPRSSPSWDWLQNLWHVLCVFLDVTLHSKEQITVWYTAFRWSTHLCVKTFCCTCLRSRSERSSFTRRRPQPNNWTIPLNAKRIVLACFLCIWSEAQMRERKALFRLFGGNYFQITHVKSFGVWQKRENLISKWAWKGSTLSQNECEKGKLCLNMGVKRENIVGRSISLPTFSKLVSWKVLRVVHHSPWICQKI